MVVLVVLFVWFTVTDVVFLYGCGDLGELHVLTHTFPTRRSSGLGGGEQVGLRVLDRQRGAVTAGEPQICFLRHVLGRTRGPRRPADEPDQALKTGRANV